MGFGSEDGTVWSIPYRSLRRSSVGSMLGYDFEGRERLLDDSWFGGFSLFELLSGCSDLKRLVYIGCLCFYESGGFWFPWVGHGNGILVDE